MLGSAVEPVTMATRPEKRGGSPRGPVPVPPVGPIGLHLVPAGAVCATPERDPLVQDARAIMYGTRSPMKRSAGVSSRPANAASMEERAERATPVANSLAKAMLP